MQLLITGPTGTPSAVDLTDKPLSLGRAVDNDLAYPDDPALSRRHLTIDKGAEGWVIRDLGSRNGTIINDAPLIKPHLLKTGDRICVGHLTIDVNGNGGELRLRAAAPSPPATTIVTTLDEVLGQTTNPGTATGPIVGSSRVVSALIRAGQELAGHRPLHDLFEVILDLALSAVEARRGVILTTEEDGLSVRASRGEGFSLSTGVRSEVLRKKTSLIISDAQFDAALREQKSIVAQRIRSIMAVPLQTADRVIGLIYVDNGSILRPFSREDLDLLTVMANVAAIRIEHARLNIVEQQERLMQSELDQACEIQRSLLPSEAPLLQNFELAGYNLACRAVGGDYYDFLPYNDGRMGLVVADVCGKGLPAALMVSSLQARVQMLMESNPDPATAITALNRNLAGRFPLGRFITAFFGLLNPITGQLDYANAGHNYPLILRRSGDVEELRGGSMVLGLFPHIEYKLQNAFLNTGDMLILYSDGVTEAARPDGDMFGEKRLADFLTANSARHCSQLVTELVAHVRAWTGAASFADDFTVTLVRRV
ncbi:MAG TPA: SpoIIE family protein phosphatase [Bryobacteraceae bacterium]|jgi:serine phosphatase RsbU (regulator of sigma subunit)|nr:SpoIIE family protein phosphatase [Bryobacteraceae bacterium]